MVKSDLEETIEISKDARSTRPQHGTVHRRVPPQAVHLASATSTTLLPDKAIDLIDEAGSKARLENCDKPEAQAREEITSS
jgi:ATP-dependent Clp protease ATP-binding subunit ClpA